MTRRGSGRPGPGHVAADRRRGLPRLQRIAAGEAMLDPVKVTLVAPGIGTDGQPRGIPASLVSAFLRPRGVVVEKTGYYSILVLFSIAVTRGKSGTLLAELFDFHRAYEGNVPVATAMPEIAAAFATRYGHLGLRDLADQMHEFLSGYDTAHAAGHLGGTARSGYDTGERVHGAGARPDRAGAAGRTGGRVSAGHVPPLPAGHPGRRAGGAIRRQLPADR